jgi:hypothetical protein
MSTSSPSPPTWKATPWWHQNEPLGRLEARLDAQQFSPAAVLPGRQVHLREDPKYGGTVPTRVSLLPATGKQAWTTYVWDGKPGDTVVFDVTSDMAAWQEIWQVAANPEGTLRRLSIGGPALFGHPWQEGPEVSQLFLANAADRGIFAPWRSTPPRSGACPWWWGGGMTGFTPQTGSM